MEGHVVDSDISVVSRADSSPEDDPSSADHPDIHRSGDPGVVTVSVQDLVSEPVEVLSHHLELELPDVVSKRVVEEGDFTFRLREADVKRLVV